DDGLQELGIFAFFADTINERTVYFQRVERQPVKVAERRITCTEIVNAQLNPKLFETVQDIDRVLGVFHRGTFGYFEFERLRRKFGSGEGMLDIVHEVVRRKMTSGNIYADDEVAANVLPSL